MSAESTRKVNKSTPSVVRAQPASDKSILESVVDFFQDVVPQAYTNVPRVDDKEKVLWTQFEICDVNDTSNNPDVSPGSGIPHPFVLTLVYVNGIQIWSVTHSGDAHELFSTRLGPVQACRLLPTPEAAFDVEDYFKSQRPLLAIAETSGAGASYSSLKLVSLRTGEEVHKLQYQQQARHIHGNKRVVLVTFDDATICYGASKMEERFRITCYTSMKNPVALGERWLAYADVKLDPVHQSCGGMTGDGTQSYAATVISAAKTLTKGLTMFSETVANSFKKSSTSSQKEQHNNEYMPGVVTIVDIKHTQTGLQYNNEGLGLIAHFPAHANEPVAALQFDPSGLLLATTCALGHNVHVFRIMAHPLGSSQGAVHHMYTLHRGDTTAQILDMAFSLDSRWLAVSSLHGTTHLFPITPYGGAISVRTHTSPGVVNKSSRFHKSAGLEDLGGKPSGRHSPLAISSSPGRHEYHNISPSNQNILNNNYSNPRLPPYPHAITVYPHVQIKQPITYSSVTGATASGSASQSTAMDCVCLAATFAPQRSWFLGIGSPTIGREKPDARQVMDSLFIMGWNGCLVEYFIDPHSPSIAPGDKVPDNHQIEVSAVPRAQWTLQRCKNSTEIRAPLSPNNQIIQAADAVVSQIPTNIPKELVLRRYDSDTSLSSDHSSTKDDGEDQWLSQVEILTHIGPHRRLWMGPQFSFKTYQNTQDTAILSSNSSALLSQSADTALTTTDIMSEEIDLQSLSLQPKRSSPVAMPGVRRVRQGSGSSDQQSSNSPAMCIEAGSYDHSPSINEVFGSWPENERLREHIADAMMENTLKDK